MASYQPLPQKEEPFTTVNFESIFTYDGPEYFSYGNPPSGSNKKLRSAFTYSSFDPTFAKVPVGLNQMSVYRKTTSYIVTCLVYLLLMLTFPVSGWFCVKKLPQHQRMVVFRLGHLLAVKGPGMILVLPCIDTTQIVDLRTKAFSVPPQQVVLDDGAIVEVGADMLYHIKDVILSVSNVQDLNDSTRKMAHTVIQRVIKGFELRLLEFNKSGAAKTVRDEINKTTLTWGVEVGEVNLSSIKLIAESPGNAGEVGKIMNILGQAFVQGGGSYPNGPIIVPESGDPVIMPSMDNRGFKVSPARSSGHVVGPAGDGPKVPDAAEYLLKAVQPILSKQLVQDFQTVYKFIVHGSTIETYYLDLKNGFGSAGRGEPVEVVDVVLTLTQDTLNDMLTGECSAMSAYMSGSLQVDGSVAKARQLQDLIDLVQIAR